MSTTLFLSPTTSATVAHVVEHVRSLRRERPLAPLTFLLPSADAIQQARRVLGNVIAVRFQQFYNLSSAVLTEAGSATHEMSDLATRRVVRGILAEMAREAELTSFAVMLEKPGFIDVLVEWLREMQTQGITPDQVSWHASRTRTPRDVQLAALYCRYDAVLRKADCAGPDGLMRQAAEALQRDRELLTGLGQVVVAGFDQFSPVQLRLVKGLAARFPLSVYLLWDADRPVTSLALGRLVPTRDALRNALAPVEVALPAVETCGPALAYVRGSLFEAGRSAIPCPAGSVSAVAAPSAETEVREALRRIKRLLLSGVREEDVALLAPQPGAYRPIVAAVSREYGVPVECETTLGENPCIAALLNLVALAPAFPWRQTFDALRSPYILQSWLSPEQVGLLDALTRERPVVRGQGQWWHALTRTAALGDEAGDPVAGGNFEALADEDRGERPLVDRHAAEEIEALREGLAAFFRHLTPPARATHAEYVAWIQDTLLGLRLEADDRENEDAEAVAAERVSLRMADAACGGGWEERDRRALHALLQALRTWLDAVALSEQLGFDPQTSREGRTNREGSTVAWEEFARDLVEWLPSVLIRPGRRQAAVRFGPLDIGRAVTVDHLFVLGLGEGEFPRPPAPDPLYTHAERAAHPLPLIRLGSAEDASLWWQVLSNCQCSLTLLRSRYDANGAEWLPSAYWSAVVDLIDGLQVEEPRLSARPSIDEAACHAELLQALVLSGARSVPVELAVQHRAVSKARAVAAEREGWAAPAAHEGVVVDDEVLADLRRRYGPGRTWSLSRLNRYGICPYAFWAQQVLELEAIADPQEGLDALQRGSLVHKILEKLFARLGTGGFAPGTADAAQIRALLDEVCGSLLPRAAALYGFRPGPLWEHEQTELRRELRAYMDWECEPKQAGAFKPFRQELKFGMGPGTGAPVTIPGLEDTTISLRGVVDRIDSDGAGHLRVIDYKTGSKPFRDCDILAGRALQSALYAWTVEELMPEAGVVVDSCYRHTGNRSESGRVTGATAHANEIVLQAAGRAVQMARAAAGGWFPAASSKPSAARACDEKCDYLGLCRVTRFGARKAHRAGQPLLGALANAPQHAAPPDSPADDTSAGVER